MTDNTYKPPPGHSTAADVLVAQQRMREAEAANNAAALRDMAVVQHSQDMQQIIGAGRSTYGTAEFDNASERVSKAFGEQVGVLTEALRAYDRPGDLVMELAKRGDDELANLQRAARGTPTRLLAQLAKMESQIAPNQTYADETPSWRKVDHTGRISRDAFFSGDSDSTGDKAWSRAFDEFSKFGRKRR
jgi:hypothetical protein